MAVTSSGAKVMHVLSSLRVGGAERFVLDLSKVQMEAGDDVMVFSCSSEQTDLHSEADKDNINCLLSSGSRWADYKAVWYFFRQKGSGKVIHLHSPFGLRFFLPLLLIYRLSGINLVYTRHGIAPLESKKWRLIHLWARMFVSSVTFVSDAGKQAFFTTHAWSENILTTISNGVYVPKDFIKKPSAKIRLGSVGRMVSLKGQRDLIESVSRLDETLSAQTEIHFFGDGPEMDNLQAHANQLLADGQTVFHGMELDRDKVYGQIDILVVCSEQEGLSLAIMEAMARRIPVIATRVGDSPKLVINQQTGLLYEYAELDSLVSHLQSLISSEAQRLELGENAHQHMIENFSLERANDLYQKCYKF